MSSRSQPVSPPLSPALNPVNALPSPSQFQLASSTQQGHQNPAHHQSTPPTRPQNLSNDTPQPNNLALAPAGNSSRSILQLEQEYLANNPPSAPSSSHLRPEPSSLIPLPMIQLNPLANQPDFPIPSHLNADLVSQIPTLVHPPTTLNTNPTPIQFPSNQPQYQNPPLTADVLQPTHINLAGFSTPQAFSVQQQQQQGRFFAEQTEQFANLHPNQPISSQFQQNSSHHVQAQTNKEQQQQQQHQQKQRNTDQTIQLSQFPQQQQHNQQQTHNQKLLHPSQQQQQFQTRQSQPQYTDLNSPSTTINQHQHQHQHHHSHNSHHHTPHTTSNEHVPVTAGAPPPPSFSNVHLADTLSGYRSIANTNYHNHFKLGPQHRFSGTSHPNSQYDRSAYSIYSAAPTIAATASIDNQYRHDQYQTLIQQLFDQLASLNQYPTPVLQQYSKLQQHQYQQQASAGFFTQSQRSSPIQPTPPSSSVLNTPTPPQQYVFSPTQQESSTLGSLNSGMESKQLQSIVLTEPCVRRSDLLTFFLNNGIRHDDPRVSGTIRAIFDGPTFINWAKFHTLLSNDFLLRKVLQHQFIIPDFPQYTNILRDIFHTVEKNQSGQSATYIPQLANVNPNQFGLGLCTIDGQQFSLGDSDVPFCIQSCSKPITYCAILQTQGIKHVHQHIGRQASGRGFNERILDENGLPHNPMINSGAIMSVSLFYPDLTEDARFDKLITLWKQLSASQRVTFNNSTYLSERATADRNFSLAYMMKEAGTFHAKSNLVETLELYFMQCSIELTCSMMSVVAATLANGGVNPLTNETIFDSSTVRYMLSLCANSGMYDSSGEFAFSVGFPTKSGVSGVIMMIIPGKMGIATWSPRLDMHGNSVRGVQFCQQLMKLFDLHIYSNVQFKPPNPMFYEYIKRVKQYIIQVEQQIQTNATQALHFARLQQQQQVQQQEFLMDHSHQTTMSNHQLQQHLQQDKIEEETLQASIDELQEQQHITSTDLKSLYDHLRTLSTTIPAPTISTIQHSLITAAFLNNIPVYSQSIALLAAVDFSQIAANADLEGDNSPQIMHTTNNNVMKGLGITGVPLSHRTNNSTQSTMVATGATTAVKDKNVKKDIMKDGSSPESEATTLKNHIFHNVFQPVGAGGADDALELTKSVLDTISYDGYKIIEIAAIMGHVELVNLLLVAGVDVVQFNSRKIMSMGIYINHFKSDGFGMSMVPGTFTQEHCACTNDQSTGYANRIDISKQNHLTPRKVDKFILPPTPTTHSTSAIHTTPAVNSNNNNNNVPTKSNLKSPLNSHFTNNNNNTINSTAINATPHSTSSTTKSIRFDQTLFGKKSNPTSAEDGKHNDDDDDDDDDEADDTFTDETNDVETEYSPSTSASSTDSTMTASLRDLENSTFPHSNVRNIDTSHPEKDKQPQSSTDIASATQPQLTTPQQHQQQQQQQQAIAPPTRSTLTNFTENTLSLISNCLYHRRLLCCQLIKLSQVHYSPHTLHVLFDGAGDLVIENTEDTHNIMNDRAASKILVESSTAPVKESMKTLHKQFWNAMQANITHYRHQHNIYKRLFAAPRETTTHTTTSTTAFPGRANSHLPAPSSATHANTSTPTNRPKHPFLPSSSSQHPQHTHPATSSSAALTNPPAPLHTAALTLKPATSMLIKPMSYKTTLSLHNLIRRHDAATLSNPSLSSLALQDFLHGVSTSASDRTQYHLATQPPIWLYPLVSAFDFEGLHSVNAARLCAQILSLGYEMSLCHAILQAVDHFVAKESTLASAHLSYTAPTQFNQQGYDQQYRHQHSQTLQQQQQPQQPQQPNKPLTSGDHNHDKPHHHAATTTLSISNFPYLDDIDTDHHPHHENRSVLGGKDPKTAQIHPNHHESHHSHHSHHVAHHNNHRPIPTIDPHFTGCVCYQYTSLMNNPHFEQLALQQSHLNSCLDHRCSNCADLSTVNPSSDEQDVDDSNDSNDSNHSDNNAKRHQVLGQIQSLALNLFPFHSRYRVVPTPKQHPIFDYLTYPPHSTLTTIHSNELGSVEQSRTHSSSRKASQATQSAAGSALSPDDPQPSLISSLLASPTIHSHALLSPLSESSNHNSHHLNHLLSPAHTVISPRISFIAFAKLLAQHPIIFLIATNLVAVPNWGSFVSSIQLIARVVAKEERRALFYMQYAVYFGVEFDQVKKVLEKHNVDLDDVLDRPHLYHNVNLIKQGAKGSGQLTTLSHKQNQQVHNDSISSMKSPQMTIGNNYNSMHSNDLASILPPPSQPTQPTQQAPHLHPTSTHLSQHYLTHQNSVMPSSATSNSYPTLTPSLDVLDNDEDPECTQPVCLGFEDNQAQNADYGTFTKLFLQANFYSTHFIPPPPSQLQAPRITPTTSPLHSSPSFSHFTTPTAQNTAQSHSTTHTQSHTHHHHHHNQPAPSSVPQRPFKLSSTHFLDLPPTTVHHLYLENFQGCSDEFVTHLDYSTNQAMLSPSFYQDQRDSITYSLPGQSKTTTLTHLTQLSLQLRLATAPYSFDDDMAGHSRLSRNTNTNANTNAHSSSQLAPPPSLPLMTPARSFRSTASNLASAASSTVLIYDYEGCTSLLLEPTYRLKAKVCPESAKAVIEHEKEMKNADQKEKDRKSRLRSGQITPSNQNKLQQQQQEQQQQQNQYSNHGQQYGQNYGNNGNNGANGHQYGNNGANGIGTGFDYHLTDDQSQQYLLNLLPTGFPSSSSHENPTMTNTYNDSGPNESSIVNYSGSTVEFPHRSSKQLSRTQLINLPPNTNTNTSIDQDDEDTIKERSEGDHGHGAMKKSTSSRRLASALSTQLRASIPTYTDQLQAQGKFRPNFQNFGAPDQNASFTPGNPLGFPSIMMSSQSPLDPTQNKQFALLNGGLQLRAATNPSAALVSPFFQHPHTPRTPIVNTRGGDEKKEQGDKIAQMRPNTINIGSHDQQSSQNAQNAQNQQQQQQQQQYGVSHSDITQLLSTPIFPSSFSLDSHDPNTSKQPQVGANQLKGGDFSAQNQNQSALSVVSQPEIPLLTPLPSQFGLSICTVTSQKVSFGATTNDQSFCVQSLFKVVNYCIVQELFGEELVHSYVGKESSGRDVGELCLDHNNLPHNPYINSGAIMCCALLLLPHLTMSQRFELILGYFRRLTGYTGHVTYNIPHYLHEKENSDRNYCLAFMIKDNAKFPEHIRTHKDVDSLLDLVCLCSSIQLTTQQIALIASTLANGGVNPITNEKIFATKTVRNALSIMATCGLYNFTGEFGFHIGLPAKSSSDGILMVCVPGLMGLCLTSPILDESGLSVIATRFLFRMARYYQLHVYDNSYDTQVKKCNPRDGEHAYAIKVVQMLCAAKNNDIFSVIKLLKQGISPDCCDGFGRTPLHVAVQYGNVGVVNTLLQARARSDLTDINGFTPRTSILARIRQEGPNVNKANSSLSTTISTSSSQPSQPSHPSQPHQTHPGPEQQQLNTYAIQHAQQHPSYQDNIASNHPLPITQTTQQQLPISIASPHIFQDPNDPSYTQAPPLHHSHTTAPSPVFVQNNSANSTTDLQTSAAKALQFSSHTHLQPFLAQGLLDDHDLYGNQVHPHQYNTYHPSHFTPPTRNQPTTSLADLGDVIINAVTHEPYHTHSAGRIPATTTHSLGSSLDVESRTIDSTQSLRDEGSTRVAACIDLLDKHV